MRPMALVACAGAVLSVAGAARGQTVNWAAPASGLWRTATNWSPMSVPDTTAEDAVLGFATGYVVTVSGETLTIGALQVNNPLAELRIDPSTATGFTDLFCSRDITNNGLIRLVFEAGTTNDARFLINTNGLTMSGTGEVRLEKYGDTYFYLNVGGGGTFTNGPGHRITGTGVLTGGGATYINNGTILANLAGGMQIGSPLTNAGTLRAVTPGALTLVTTVTQTGAGFIEADGTTVTLSNNIVSNNTIRSVNGGSVMVAPGAATVNNVVSEGSWVIPASTATGFTDLFVGGTWTNNALVSLPANTGTTNDNRLVINTNGLVINGTGEIRLGEFGDSYLYLNVGGGGTITNSATHRITGTGTITGGGATLINNGTIYSDVPGGLQIDCPLSNNVPLKVKTPATLTLTTTVTQAGAGLLEVDGTTLTLVSNTINSGVVRSINGGTVTMAPGSVAINNITTEGNWVVPASTTTGFDDLAVAGTWTNNALVSLPANAGTTNNNRILINTNGLVINGTGEIRLGEFGDSYLYLNVGGGGLITNSATHSITGTGIITGGGAALVNNGTIYSDVAGGLEIDCPLNNNVPLKVKTPSALTLTNVLTQPAAGVVEVDGTTLTLTGNTLNGGTVRSINGGAVMLWPGTTINGVTTEGSWVLAASSGAGFTDVNIVNSWTNNGHLHLPANPGTTNNARVLINTNGLVIGGTGEISLEESDDTMFYLNVGGGGVVTNGAGHRLSGVGTIQGGGAALFNEGTLAPGAPYGTLHTTAPINLRPTSVLEIELAGDLPAQRDLLDATGTAVTLGGTLKVVLRDGYALPACSSFVVVNGNLSGVFAAEDLPVMAQGVISVSYGTHTVTIGYIPGDLNGDSLLDFADYLEFLNLYDAQDIRADLNQDGFVDFGDYLEFLNLYNMGC